MTGIEKIAQQKRRLRWLITALAVGGVLIALLARRLPVPLRFFLAASDLAAAGFLWVAVRQASQKR